ncbi:MAG TPA: hypothetical protein DCE43_07305, partial [Planctomycetaceae bacterium]|nr:hypothetical protein [Planctomycetaceae bacterium]
AAQLLGEASGDCLEQTDTELETLQSPEPNFFVLGSKSYGRDSRFLLRTGLRQVDIVTEHLVGQYGCGHALS